MDIPPIKILLVESNPQKTHAVTLLFTGDEIAAQCPCCVETIAQGAHLIDNAKWNALLIDLQVCNSSGEAILKKIRYHNPTLPIIALCDSHEEHHASALKGSVIDDYCVRETLTSALLRHSLAASIELRKMRIELHHLRMDTENTESLFSILAMQAHNLNNPLCGISGTIQLQLMNENTPENLVQMFNVMLGQSKKMSEIVSTMFRMVSWSDEPSTTFGVDETVTQAIDRWSTDAGAKDITILPDLTCGATIEGHRSEFRRAIGHCIANGIDAIDGGGTIAISTSVHEKRCFITIADTGRGMSPEALQNAFAPLFTTKSGPGHKGLGLSLVKCVIDRYKGSVELESTPEKGSTLTLSVPLWN
jgi:signal transduction histidine kinase